MTFQPNPKELDGVPDLCQLKYLGEDHVLHNLSVRYKSQAIYTSVTAKVLVAVNPYEKIEGSDSELTMAKYQASPVNLEGLLDSSDLSPHTFTVAHAAYHNMIAKQKDQSVIVCGESGSGKTESAKLLMRFLAYTSTITSSDPKKLMAAEQVGKQVLDANPILETFGNAKTIINNNSSRFGKFTKMLFEDGQLIGAQIETYLLEKSRVARQDKNERNYHAFYHAVSQAAEHPDWQLTTDPTDFHYLNQSGCTTVDGDAGSDARDYRELVAAMDTLNISKEEQNGIFKVVAGVLHLGNVAFKDDSTGEGCELVDMAPVRKAAQLFNIDEDKLVDRLTKRSMQVVNKMIVTPQRKAEAADNRDSIAMLVYDGLFRWIVQRINQESFPADKANSGYIGILDVFGFEIFQHNSFEQLCINFANERLQEYFNFHVLKAEQDLYRREALLWTPIDLPDNSDCIELLTARPYGLFALLDSTCVQPKGNDEVFTQTLFQYHANHPRIARQTKSPTKGGTMRRGSQFSKMNGFSIKHYAAEVVYDAKEFLAKNTDSVHVDTLRLFNASKDAITSQVLGVKPSGPSNDASKRRSSYQFQSTSLVFSRQLTALMATLDQTTPYFVRCIKPNPNKAPRDFEPDFVRPQLRCGGLVEALRIIKCGFPTRCSYEKMWTQFGSVLKGYATPVNVNKRDFTEAMIHVTSPMLGEKIDKSQYQLGLTMVFFRPGQQEFFRKILQLTPAQISTQQVAEIRKFLVHKRIVRMRGTIRAWLRAKHFLAFRRFQRAAQIMTVVHKTMGKALNRARLRIAHKRDEKDRVARLQDEKYQKALAASKELEAMKAKEAKLKAKLDAEAANAKRAQDAKDEVESQMKLMMNKVQALTKKLVEADAKAQQEAAAARAAKAEAVEKERALAAAQADKDRAAADARRAQEEQQRTAADKSRAEAAAQEHEMALQGLRRELDSLRGELSGAQASEARYKALAENTGGEKNQLLDELRAMERQLNDSKSAAARTAEQLAREQASARDRESRLQSELQGKDNAVRAVNQQVEDLTARLAAAQQSMGGELDALRRENDELRRQLDEAKDMLAREQDETSRARDAAKRAEQRAQALQDELRQTELRLSREAGEKGLEVEKLKHEREMAARRTEDLERELRELRARPVVVPTPVPAGGNAMGDERFLRYLRQKDDAIEELNKDLRLASERLAAAKGETRVVVAAAEEKAEAFRLAQQERLDEVTALKAALNACERKAADAQAQVRALELEQLRVQKGAGEATLEAESLRRDLAAAREDAAAEASRAAANLERATRAVEDARRAHDADRERWRETERALNNQIRDLSERRAPAAAASPVHDSKARDEQLAAALATERELEAKLVQSNEDNRRLCKELDYRARLARESDALYQEQIATLTESLNKSQRQFAAFKQEALCHYEMSV